MADIHSRTESQLTVERPSDFDDIALGSSIAVAGVCLSIVAFDDFSMTFDVIEETWAKTKLGSLLAGDRVNIERAMKASDRLDGHIVQGHCEAAVPIVSRTADRITIEVPESLAQSIVDKGSITLDGVSLTVAAVDGNTCTVALIPHTLEHTTLGAVQEGGLLNCETDVLVRHAQKLAPTYAH